MTSITVMLLSYSSEPRELKACPTHAQYVGYMTICQFSQYWNQQLASYRTRGVTSVHSRIRLRLRARLILRLGLPDCLSTRGTRFPAVFRGNRGATSPGLWSSIISLNRCIL